MIKLNLNDAKIRYKKLGLGKKTDSCTSEQPHTVKYNRHNVAHKLNYCNGGQNEKQVGYYGVCSEDIIRYNIEEKHRVWCSNPKCRCFQYYSGKISYQDIINDYPEEWPCYESATLMNWKVSAGANKDGTPRKIKSAEEKSLCVLTTLLPKTKEEERIIIAAFIIDEVFTGDDEAEGHVTADKDYCLELSLNEAKQLHFWDYYVNPYHPEKKAWGTGLIRYFNDEIAAKMLSRMVEVKSDEEGKQKAKSMLDQYIKLHRGLYNNGTLI